ncbi:MAG TPA: diguanylate cyclase [Thermoanaerobaculia bacterium]|nr:diguanylate cyclase [Thermoanaerobaculia bacterium]
MRRRFWLGYALVLAIAVGSIALALVVLDRETTTFEQRQQAEAVRSARQAEALAALSVGQLDSTAAFYEAEADFGRHEFDVIADSLLGNGALSATAFVPLVRHSERRRFERRYGFPIQERGTLGDLRRERRRDRYFPLAYAASDTELDLATPYGYDLGADPVRATHLLDARDSGKPAATPAIRLPLGGTGINVFRPVYRDGAPTRTVAERRAALTGFALGSFRIGDLATAALTALEEDDDIQLLERGRSLYGAPLDREDSASAPVKIADRTWVLVVRDDNRPGVGWPVLIAVVGVALAALLGALVVSWSRKEKMQELQRQASQDPLTGLKNRRRFGEDLRAELARSRRDGSEGAVLMLDLDNFKQVNDTLGHPEGDRVIAEIAGVLRSRMRETDVVARLGGDEFGLVLPHCDADEAEAVANEIASAIRDHVSSDEAVPPITASVGAAMFGPDPRVTMETLMVEADTAMYEAKREERGGVRMAGSRPGGALASGPNAVPDRLR